MRKISKDNLLEKDLQLYSLRHTAEHVLHTAMQNLYPNLKKAMGPAIEEGFYFDFDLEEKVSETDFPKIEQEMQKLIKMNLKMVQDTIPLDQARGIFAANPYKMDWINQIVKRGENLSIYKIIGHDGKIHDLDLCSGPHVYSTGEIKAFKLLSIAGAYWHGDEKNKMLTSIYGTAFNSKQKLELYLLQKDKAEKRDHRKLGQQLDLFSINPLTGSGLILWHPKLARVRNIVEQFWKDIHYEKGYQLVNTPHIASMDMFVISRHLSKYINYMFPVMLHEFIEGESSSDYKTDEVLKPMNCPNHIQIYKVRPRSYRELPMRIGELGTVYRYERAGVLHGMTRVRGFTQDDSHIFCTADQVIGEVREVLKIMKYFYKIFGFTDYQTYISTRPEKFLGSIKMWDFAESSLKQAAKEEGFYFKIDKGEGVFYGPKIDMKVKDSLDREWQLGTVQFDFNQPAHAESTEEEINEFWALKTFRQKFKTKDDLGKYIRHLGRGFNVTYINKNGKEEQCMMIHRVVLGSMERFFGILIEHYGGAFPAWLAPIQIIIIPIAERHNIHAQKIARILKAQNIRVEVNSESGTMQSKIRDAALQKVPYLGIIGDKEVQNREESVISVRTRDGKDLGQMSVHSFLKKLKSEIEKKY